jgi:hypothetical protein
MPAESSENSTKRHTGTTWYRLAPDAATQLLQKTPALERALTHSAQAKFPQRSQVPAAARSG